MNNQTFSPISAFVKPEKLHPVDLFCTILLIFGAIPFGIMKFKQLFAEALVGHEIKSLKKKKKYKRNLMRKARIAKEIGVRPKDLTDYRMMFVGLEEQTSSGEERSLVRKYRKDYGDKADLISDWSSDDSEVSSEGTSQ